MPSIASQISNQQSMILTVNGNVMQGKVAELKEGVAPEQAYQAGKGDGLDQVYVSAQGKNYVIQGEGMDFSAIEKSDMPFVQIHIGDEAIWAEVKGTDNETNTFKEGLWNWGTIGGLIGAGGSAGLMVWGAAEGTVDNGLGAVMGGASLGVMALGVAGVSALGGGIYGAVKGADASQLEPLLKK